MASSHPSHSAPASLGEPRQRAAATSDAAHGTSPLLPALAGERRFIQHQGRKLALYLSMPQANPGNRNLTPLLLLHTISAAASAAEVKPVFDLYAHKRPVIALELPGFGSSDRSRIVYTPALMSDAITHTLEHIRQLGFGRPADVLAVSLSCELSARAALALPDRIRSLALISPTGLEKEYPERYDGGRTKDKPWLRKLLEAGPWAKPLFRTLTSEKSMRKFLERTWGSEHISENLLAYNLLTVQMPGARHAPFAFIAGSLFTKGVAHLYGQLKQPVWMAHGVHGEFANFDGLAALGPPPNWRVERFETGALPYFETPAMFATRYETFLQTLPDR